MTGRLLSAEDFGKTIDPPKSKQRILRLCRDKRIVGAIRPGNEWLIPEGAPIKGEGVRIEYGKNKGLSVKQYARLHGRSEARVYKLLKQKRIEGAKKGPHGWDIPESAPWPAETGIEYDDGSKGVNAREYAKMNKVSHQRVYQLLEQGRIAGATKTEHGWRIPPDAPYPVGNS